MFNRTNAIKIASLSAVAALGATGLVACSGDAGSASLLELSTPARSPWAPSTTSRV